jgi:GT2 family glycosyltransferase
METISLPEEFVRGRVGIATVLFNSEKVLPDFLDSLHAQTYKDMVVYAVDNASTDRSVEICLQQGNRLVVIANTENSGFAHATNQGIRLALQDGCEFVLLLNNDVAFRSDFLAQLVAGLQRNNADTVAPLTYYHDRPDIIWAAGGRLQRIGGFRPVHLGMGQRDNGQFPADLRIDFAPGSGILVRRSVFATVGLLDENFFTYWEDTDFAVRTLRAGLRSYLIPSAKLWHKVSSLSGMNSPFQQFYAVRNHALYICKHCAPIEARLLSGLYLSWYQISEMFAPQGSRVQSWKAGLKLARDLGF